MPVTFTTAEFCTLICIGAYVDHIRHPGTACAIVYSLVYGDHPRESAPTTRARARELLRSSRRPAESGLVPLKRALSFHTFHSDGLSTPERFCAADSCSRGIKERQLPRDDIVRSPARTRLLATENRVMRLEHRQLLSFCRDVSSGYVCMASRGKSWSTREKERRKEKEHSFGDSAVRFVRRELTRDLI